MELKFLIALSVTASSLLLASCGNRHYLQSSQPQINNPTVYSNNQTPRNQATHASAHAQSVLNSAYKYLKTPYKLGGESYNGMDCSGLVLKAFSENGINLPRTSADQATKGVAINLSAAVPGDLIFFDTNATGRINHVGIVTNSSGEQLEFIHSSSSKGVKVSSLSSSYWSARLVAARRILD